MTPQKFNSLANGLMSQASKVRNAKMVEYEAETDRLANFRKAANLNSQTVPEAIAGMMIKHTVSIYDMISAEFGTYQTDPPHSIELWREKLVDQINYLLLLYAAVREARE
jgi:TPP-dependent 2-oxoacid decarboxylase